MTTANQIFSPYPFAVIQKFYTENILPMSVMIPESGPSSMLARHPEFFFNAVEHDPGHCSFEDSLTKGKPLDSRTYK